MKVIYLTIKRINAFKAAQDGIEFLNSIQIFVIYLNI
jgi:hypothetical protein